MKKIILIVIVVGMLGYATYEFVSSSDETGQEDNEDISGAMITSPPADNEGKVEKSDEVGLEKGKIAPDFELETLEGETVRLSDYKGERVIVNFWATWCPPCRAEIPDLVKLYDKKDVTILAVNLSEDNIADFVEKFEMTFPILMDADSDVSSAYRVQAYPTSYMIDSNGRIQFVKLGPMNYDLMVQELEKMK